jgi:hypothetical protein
MMTHEPPPQDLWDRLRQLDRQCNLSIDRCGAPDPVMWGSPRIWQVSIHAARVPGARIWDTVRGSHATLAEAIRMAVEQAEEKGWHLRIAG